MTVPGRVEAAELLLSLDPPAWFLNHSRAVAEVAGWLALRAREAGACVDGDLVESAALLHDVDKLLPAADPARRRPHGEGSAAWLARRGHAELGPAVTFHPVTVLATEDRARRLAAATLEERIVAYADKRAGQRLESMAARFASWQRRYPDGWSDAEAATVRRSSEQLEREVCLAARVAPVHVQRLRWTSSALRSATVRVEARAS
jgi:HD superfamily phosphodiesterase